MRAVCGLALGPTDVVGGGAVAMVNLLGDLWAARRRRTGSVALADPTPACTSTARREPRPGRKMGHLTVLGDGADDVVRGRSRLRAARHTLTPTSWPIT